MMRNLILAAAAALSMGMPALAQDSAGMVDFNGIERECRQADPAQPMHPFCHVFVYEQWRQISGHTFDESRCDMAAFWRVADEVVPPLLRQRPFVEAFDLVLQQGGVCEFHPLG